MNMNELQNQVNLIKDWIIAERESAPVDKIAAKVGVSRRTIYHIIGGQYRPNWDTLAKFDPYLPKRRKIA